MTTSYIKSEHAAKSFMAFALISTNAAAASRTRLLAGALLRPTSPKVFQLVRVRGEVASDDISERRLER